MYREFIKKNALIFYFLLCYIIMTIAVIIQIIFNVPTFTHVSFNIVGFILWFLQAFSPTISAIIITGIISGKNEIKNLFKGFSRWKVGLIWYFAALLFIIAPLGAGILYVIFGGEAPGIDPNLTVQIFVFLVIFGMFSGPLSEETGWRGFALPRLESKYSALVSSLILGILWTFWHLPLYFIPGSSQSGIPFPIYMILVVSITIIMTWAYNNTNGSLIITVLIHFCFNFGSTLVVSTLGLMPMMIFFIVGGVLIIVYLAVVIAHGGSEKLSRRPDEAMPFIKLTNKRNQ